MSIRLDKAVIVQKRTKDKTKKGFNEERWIDYKKIIASMNNLWGKEFYAAKAINEERTIEFITRYSKELEQINSKEYRLFFNNRAFNITFIDNIKYENKWLKIKAIEVN